MSTFIDEDYHVTKFQVTVLDLTFCSGGEGGGGGEGGSFVIERG